MKTQWTGDGWCTSLKDITFRYCSSAKDFALIPSFLLPCPHLLIWNSLWVISNLCFRFLSRFVFMLTSNSAQFPKTSFQFWTRRLTCVSPTSGPTPSLFSGRLPYLLSRATDFGTRKQVVGEPRTIGSPHPRTTSLWPDWNLRLSTWSMCTLSMTMRKVNL